MEQIERIGYYEALLDRLEPALGPRTLSAAELAALRGPAEELARYYGSADWKRDFADDEAGLLPAGLKRGVLSEDGIYNALETLRERQEEAAQREARVKSLAEQELKIFDLFANQWALVAAGAPARYNACTLSWGGMGTLWNRPVVTVYVHPGRYTQAFLLGNDSFTLSFFPESCRKALGYMGSHSGRDGDKAAACGLTPVPLGESVAFREASLRILCKKLYQHPFAVEDLAPEIRDYYAAHPGLYPADSGPGWQPHWVFVGEILDAEE